MTPLHPLLAEMAAKAALAPPMRKVPLDALREAVARQLDTGLPKPTVGSVEDVSIPSGVRPLRLRIYRPAGKGPFPLTVFFHGSGFTVCSIETHDAMCRHVCNGAGSIIVSADYALAPEQPFPAGPDDCWEATLWSAVNASRLGADASRLALCGDSAGGAMAIATALRARGAGAPRIAALALIYPVTDHYSAGHASYEERGAGAGLSRENMRWFWDNYLPDAAQAGDPTVSPARSANLGGLPQTFISTAEYDVLRDEGRAFARAIEKAGVPVTVKHYEDMNHGFLNWTGVIPRADEAMADMTGWMRQVLHPQQENA